MKTYIEWRYNSTLALDGGKWSTSCPFLFNLGKQSQYPLYMGLGGPHSQSGHYREEKNLLPLLGIKP
jgi:hypothetical protein